MGNDFVMPEWLIQVIIWTLIPGAVVLVLRLKKSSEAAQRRLFDGLQVDSTPQPGMVSVVFHTYYGFLVYVIQTEHRFWAAPPDARIALWRLHKFNLTWGLLAYCALVIPLISYLNYLPEKRSITRQEAQLACGPRGISR